jgi:hypothetical protein
MEGEYYCNGYDACDSANYYWHNPQLGYEEPAIRQVPDSIHYQVYDKVTGQILKLVPKEVQEKFLREMLDGVNLCQTEEEAINNMKYYYNYYSNHPTNPTFPKIARDPTPRGWCLYNRTARKVLQPVTEELMAEFLEGQMEEC